MVRKMPSAKTRGGNVQAKARARERKERARERKERARERKERLLKKVRS